MSFIDRRSGIDRRKDQFDLPNEKKGVPAHGWPSTNCFVGGESSD